MSEKSEVLSKGFTFIFSSFLRILNKEPSLPTSCPFASIKEDINYSFHGKSHGHGIEWYFSWNVSWFLKNKRQGKKKENPYTLHKVRREKFSEIRAVFWCWCLVAALLLEKTGRHPSFYKWQWWCHRMRVRGNQSEDKGPAMSQRNPGDGGAAMAIKHTAFSPPICQCQVVLTSWLAHQILKTTRTSQNKRIAPFHLVHWLSLSFLMLQFGLIWLLIPCFLPTGQDGISRLLLQLVQPSHLLTSAEF